MVARVRNEMSMSTTAMILAAVAAAVFLLMLPPTSVEVSFLPPRPMVVRGGEAMAVVAAGM